MNIGLISGGVAGNVVPPSASALVKIRISTNLAEVRAKVDKILQREPLVKLEVKQAIEETFCSTVEGFKTGVMKFGTGEFWSLSLFLIISNRAEIFRCDITSYSNIRKIFGLFALNIT